MCLEFLCNWRHHDEDELHRGSPNYSTEHKIENNYPTKDDPPSKPRKDYYDYPSKDDPPLKPHRDQSSGTENVFKGEYDTYPARDGPPLKPRREVYNGSESGPKGGNQLPTGVVVNGDTPVQQPNDWIVADSSAFHGNGHYHTVDESGRRNRNMQKEEEEDEEEEGGRVAKVAELKNRRYF